MSREIKQSCIHEAAILADLGLSVDYLADGMNYCYHILDTIDAVLATESDPRLSSLVELANLSTIIGNLLRHGISKSSNGLFEANGPHKYPDLLGKGDGCSDVEIKIALEDNNPKGHLVKPGPHITARYVLGNETCEYDGNSRGDMVWFYELRVGFLKAEHFNVSNTPGDSGKTAVINAAGLRALSIIYYDDTISALGPILRRQVTTIIQQQRLI